MDGCPTILADSWLVLKISLTKLDKMKSNGDFLPLTRTPKVGNTTSGVFLCRSLFEKWDGLINEATDDSELALLQKDRELIWGWIPLGSELI